MSSNVPFQTINDSYPVVRRDPDAHHGHYFWGVWLGLHTRENPLREFCNVKDLPIAKVKFVSLIWQRPEWMSQLTLEHTPIQPITFRGPREVNVCVRGLGGEVGGIFKKTRQIFRIISGDIQGEDQERKCFFCEFSFKSWAITQKKKKKKKDRLNVN